MKCIICLTDTNLNTHMKVEIDGETYEVHLCDEHAEETSMAKVNKKVKEIKDKLKNAVQLAIDLGISIPEINIGVSKDVMPDLDILPTATATPAPAVIISAAEEPADIDVAADKSKIKREAVAVKLSDKEEIKCDTDITMQDVEIRGSTVQLPKHTKGESGTSDITILNTNDTTIQNQFKNLKHQGDTGQVSGSYAADCLACHGTGIHPILKKECPKCKGTGMRI